MLSDCNDNAPLPAYLARHINLDFDSDDIAAFITSIESSQRSSPATLPQLPAEILILILENVPVDFILEFRLVCRGFRDVIDTKVFFSYLPRIELIGYAGPYTPLPTILPAGFGYNLSEEDYERLHLLRSQFERMDCRWNGAREGGKWGATHAIFRLDDSWFDALEEVEVSVNRSDLEDVLFNQLGYFEGRDDHGALHWCLKLDHAVLDLDFSSEAMLSGGELSLSLFEVNIIERTVMVSWKEMLWQFLKLESFIRKKMEETQSLPKYTFSHREDSLRAVRRQWLRSKLDLGNRKHREFEWAMNNTLIPLFGKKDHDEAEPPWHEYKFAEDDAARVLMRLRREATLSLKKLSHLQQLAKERENMAKEHQTMSNLFAAWKKNIYSMGPIIWRSSLQEKVPINPTAWTEDIIAREERRINRWRSQQKTIEQLMLVLESSNATMEIEDSFDNPTGEFEFSNI
ncbi:hypothetical protein CC78DRAFT_28721 [Lojkania enalia]|uniref:F-box domain-containing protein n=1 Tax=Lojkania enalia TaxID=147567 RepID=A0A9P4K3V2_9PLEO|nr:hypothetical protein CC78DRAFT_28721 [Didymosphaeria enalia]